MAEDKEKQKVAKHAESDAPAAREVEKFHTHADTDGSPKALHHSLGPNANQAASGNHSHDGGGSTKLTSLMEGMTVTGAKGGNVALTNLLVILRDNFGLTDNTT